jgi:D-alanyl-lipoteichoic acid acyltransferase DltB (MBOAT superfamily)
VLFNSFEFIVFLPIVSILYWFVFKKSLRWQNLLVLTASYFFYGWWSFKFLGLLVISTLLDYCYGFLVASPNKLKSKIFLWASIVNNLGILAVFKYYNFFALQFQQAFELIGIRTNPLLLDIALPIGISFYTFHGMSYVFDIYRGKQKPVNNFIEYAVFVSFFPLLVAGPIERANHLLPQVQQKRLFNYTQAIDGCRLILWGLAKKVILADYLAGIADNAFNNYAQYDGLSLIIGAIAFSFQIYGDFSGYSDIAIGTAKLFGFELLSNFKFPYFSRDIAEFWRRWHISLSSWFKDYLYIPLGGSHNGTFKAVRNTFIIFLISGFWHGASWNFIIWGGIHACAFLPLLLLKRNRIFVTNIVAEDRRLPNWREIWQMATTFMFVTIAWIFFRAQNLEHAIGYITQILTSIIHQPASILKPRGLTTFIYITPFVLIDWWQRRDERILKVPSNKIIRIVIYYFIVYKCILLMGEQSTFIYFQF